MHIQTGFRNLKVCFWANNLDGAKKQLVGLKFSKQRKLLLAFSNSIDVLPILGTLDIKSCCGKLVIFSRESGFISLWCHLIFIPCILNSSEITTKQNGQGTRPQTPENIC